jgi:hypothetical protein
MTGKVSVLFFSFISPNRPAIRVEFSLWLNGGLRTVAACNA